MAEKKYQVQFKGEIAPGENKKDVKRKLAALLRLEPGNIEARFFSGNPVILKSNLDYQTALKFKETLAEKTGGVFEVVPWKTCAPSKGGGGRPAETGDLDKQDLTTDRLIPKKKKRLLFAIPVAVLIIIPVLIFGYTLFMQKAEVQGDVKDPFGNPLGDVLVKAGKTSYQARTSNDGRYTVGYVPGKFTLLFSKPGYGTRNLELTLEKKKVFPAESLVLYPVPKDGPGLYCIGGKQLLKLPSCLFRPYKDMSFQTIWRGMQVIKSGKAAFIDSGTPNGEEMLLVRLKTDQIKDFQFHVGKGYQVVKHKTEHVGNEGLIIRTAEVAPGFYVWMVPPRKNDTTDKVGVGPGYCFQAGAKEMTLTKPPIPLDRALGLVNQSMADLASAIKAKDFKPLYKKISSLWQSETTPAKLSGIFKDFTEKKIDLTKLKDVRPEFTEYPFRDIRGWVVLQGYYPTKPFAVIFIFKYIKEDAVWKLNAVNLSVQDRRVR